MQDRQKIVTLKDVAEKAGVSVNTASRALRDMPDIGDSTKEEVQKIAAELGYRKNQVAVRLKTNLSHQIGLISGDILNPFISSFLSGVSETSFTRDYNVLLTASASDYREEEKRVMSFIDCGVDGILIHPSDRPARTITPFLNMLKQLNCPYLIIGAKYPNADCNYVAIDDFFGGYAAAEHLHSLGHRRFGLLIPQAMTSSPHLDRISGFKAYLTEHGLVPDACIFQPQWPATQNSPRDAIAQLIEHIHDFTAVFCFCDYYAAELYSALLQKGIRIPQDISVMGFDNQNFCEWLWPPLTTVNIDSVALGEISARELLQLIEYPSETLEVRRQITMKPALVIRASTAQV